MGESRGSKEHNNGDKSTLEDKSLEGSTFWVLAKDNRNMSHGGISWCLGFNWNFEVHLFI